MNQYTEKKNERLYHIDFLKTVAVLTVILTHVLNEYRGVFHLYAAWVWLHFAVGLFVVSSGFLQNTKPVNSYDTTGSLRWIGKRFLRLVLPYYVFLLAYVLLSLAFPETFGTRIITQNTSEWVETLTLHSGFGQNWIPRLFVLLTAGYYVTEMIGRRFNLTSRIYSAAMTLSLLVSVAFLLYPLDIPHRYIQTITWFSLFVFGIFLQLYYRKKLFLESILLISGIATFACYVYLSFTGRPTSVFAHEYPPTFYFVSYNILASTLLFLVALKTSTLKLAQKSWRWLQIISKHSYSIFFTHIIVIDAIQRPTGFWLTDFLIVAPVSIIVALSVTAFFDFILTSFQKLHDRILSRNHTAAAYKS